MPKILTIIIPIYNTEQYLEKCLKSLIINPNLFQLVEILLIIDGSPDNSLSIAKDFESKYPENFRVIDKENGGYGSVLQRGISEAKGKYCKVLDSDDWYDTKEFESFVDQLQHLDQDVVVTDFVKEFVFENRSELQTLSQLKDHQVIQLDEEINQLEKDVFVMHRLAYKTQILRNSNIIFPEKVFYTDTLFASIPLFFAKDLIYIKLKLYRYYIGREGQTIAPESIQKNRKSVETVITYYYEKFLEVQNNLNQQKKIYSIDSIRILFEMYYRILHHMPYSVANKELKIWNKFVQNTPNKTEFSQSKMVKYYNILPYFIFRYSSKIWNN